MYKNLVRKCLLCHETICDNTCPHKLKPSHFLRSLYFDNYIDAEKYIDKVNIKTLINNYEFKHIDEKNVDVSIKFLNKKCENPFFLASSVVSTNYDMCIEKH